MWMQSNEALLRPVATFNQSITNRSSFSPTTSPSFRYIATRVYSVAYLQENRGLQRSFGFWFSFCPSVRNVLVTNILDIF